MLKFKNTLLAFAILCGAVSFGQMHPYYQSIDFSQSAANVESALNSLITSTHAPLDYSDTYAWIKLADEDPSNINNVITMYDGASVAKTNTIGGGNTSFPEDWNREHVYPQSLINQTAKADLHHLRACDEQINGSRGSLSFKDGSGSYGATSGGWYPGDDWKGDVARMIFYVYLRYGEPITDMGTLSVLLQWNVDDPVSAFEQQRNDIIYGAQGNRNPFIDQPYIATHLWGGPAAEDLWGWPNLVEEIEVNLNLFPNPAYEQLNISCDCVINQVSIFNSVGQKVRDISSNTLDVSDWTSGNYFAVIQSGDLTKRRWFVVE